MTAPTNVDHTDQGPMSRKDLWLKVALAIAKHGLPAPNEQRENDRGYDGRRWLIMCFDTSEQADAWGQHLGLKDLGVPGHGYAYWSGHGYAYWSGHAWGWYVSLYAPKSPRTAVSPDLAAELVEATKDGA